MRDWFLKMEREAGWWVEEEGEASVTGMLLWSNIDSPWPDYHLISGTCMLYSTVYAKISKWIILFPKPLWSIIVHFQVINLYQKICPKELNRHFIKEDRQMAINHMKRCGTSCVVTELKIKTTMIYHYTPIRVCKIWNSDNSKRWQGCRTIGTYFIFGGNAKW